ncbi:MAG: DNA-processing protein DprA [Chthoniobacterales bacterium]
MTETQAFIALNMVPRLGPVRLKRLLGRFGSPQAVLAAKSAELSSVEGIGPEAAKSIANWEAQVDLENELRKIEEFGAHVLTWNSAEYPAPLKEIYDPPIVLYVWGELKLKDRHAVGVVGTRKPSHYAAEAAKKLSYQLAYAGLTVFSGLARGIDTAAHQGALAAQGRTVAVIGSGLMKLYPPENEALARRIAAGNGAVISEFSMDVKADRQSFPMRNRIVSGCSFGLLVVEAGLNSGALITATQAGEHGKSIYAVPGRIDQPGCMGSNRLIQQGAKLVISAQDVLDDFGMLFPTQPDVKSPVLAPKLEPEEQSIYEALGDEEVHIDDIAAKCGLPSHEVSSSLLALEMRRLVKQLPGARFVKLL